MTLTEATAREEVIVFPIRPFEPLVEEADALEHRARQNPEAAVEAAGLDRLPKSLPLTDDQRAHNFIGNTEVEDVSVHDAAVVVHDGDVVARRQAQPDVDIASVASAVVDHDDALALCWERRSARAKSVVRLVVDRPVRNDDTEARRYCASSLWAAAGICAQRRA